MTPQAHLTLCRQMAQDILYQLGQLMRPPSQCSEAITLNRLSVETSDLIEELDELRENPVIEATQLTDREHYIVAHALNMLITKARVESGQKVGDEEAATGFLAEVHALCSKIRSPKLRDSKGKELYPPRFPSEGNLTKKD